MANNTAKLLARFRISDNDLRSDEALGRCFDNYSCKRQEFCAAKRELEKTIGEIRGVLDGPLRSQGLVAEGRDWTFKEDDDGELVILVWSEVRQRGRKKESVPYQSLPMKKLGAA